jgi:hypothetical protein
MGGAARLEVHEEDSTAAYIPPHQRHSDSRCVATDSVATLLCGMYYLTVHFSRRLPITMTSIIYFRFNVLLMPPLSRAAFPARVVRLNGGIRS